MFAIMARFTVTRDTRMIENLSSEGIVGVANVTILRCWYMASGFNSIRIIGNKPTDMTTFAATGEAWVNSA